MTLRDRVAKAAETYLHQRADFAAPINFADLADAVIEAGLSERDAGWQPIERAREDLRAQLPYIAAPKLGQHIGRVATMPNGDWVILMFDPDKGHFTQFMTAPSPWRAPPDPKDQQA